MKSRPRQYRLSPISTAADVGQSRYIWQPSVTNTAAPISTITDIDCGRCGSIEVHLAIHRPVCRFGQALHGEPLATPSATLRVTLRSLRYVPSLHSNRLGAGLRPSPTLFVGYRLPIRIQFAVSGRHFEEICKRPPTLLFGGRLQISSKCPPSTLIGWGQACGPPPHYLSATALSSTSHRTSNVQRGLWGVAPPAPPLLRLVCSPSGALTSSGLPPAE